MLVSGPLYVWDAGTWSSASLTVTPCRPSVCLTRWYPVLWGWRAGYVTPVSSRPGPTASWSAAEVHKVSWLSPTQAKRVIVVTFIQSSVIEVLHSRIKPTTRWQCFVWKPHPICDRCHKTSSFHYWQEALSLEEKCDENFHTNKFGTKMNDLPARSKHML